MKKISILICIAALIFKCTFAFSQTIKRSQLWTIEEVQQIAQTYKFPITISNTQNNLLLYMSKPEIDAYFKRQVKNLEIGKENAVMMQKTELVKNMSDYINLIESLPLVKEQMVKAYGGIEKYNEHVLKSCKYDWRIYRDKKGALYFYRSENEISESELAKGQRIDDLQKN